MRTVRMAKIPETSSFRSRICESSRSRLSVDSVGGHVPECTDVDPVIAQLVTQQSGLASLGFRDVMLAAAMAGSSVFV